MTRKHYAWLIAAVASVGFLGCESDTIPRPEGLDDKICVPGCKDGEVCKNGVCEAQGARRWLANEMRNAHPENARPGCAFRRKSRHAAPKNRAVRAFVWTENARPRGRAKALRGMRARARRNVET